MSKAAAEFEEEVGGGGSSASAVKRTAAAGHNNGVLWDCFVAAFVVFVDGGGANVIRRQLRNGPFCAADQVWQKELVLKGFVRKESSRCTSR